MTAPHNTSFFFTSAAAESRVCKEAYRSTACNNYVVDVADFENEIHTFEVEAESESEASEQATDIAMSVGVQVSYCNGVSKLLTLGNNVQTEFNGACLINKV